MCGYPRANVAFFRRDMPGYEGVWALCGTTYFALPPDARPLPFYCLKWDPCRTNSCRNALRYDSGLCGVCDIIHNDGKGERLDD